MLSELKNSEPAVKEPKTNINVRIPVKVHGRLSQIGVPGTLGAEMVNKLVKLFELRNKSKFSAPIETRKGEYLYAAVAGPDVHLTLDCDGEIKTVKLNEAEAGALIWNLLDVLNADTNKS